MPLRSPPLPIHTTTSRSASHPSTPHPPSHYPPSLALHTAPRRPRRAHFQFMWRAGGSHAQCLAAASRYAHTSGVFWPHSHLCGAAGVTTATASRRAASGATTSSSRTRWVWGVDLARRAAMQGCGGVDLARRAAMQGCG
eukprot:363760-Chlamydomonas_euryale.AAC.13